MNLILYSVKVTCLSKMLACEIYNIISAAELQVSQITSRRTWIGLGTASNAPLLRIELSGPDVSCVKLVGTRRKSANVASSSKRRRNDLDGVTLLIPRSRLPTSSSSLPLPQRQCNLDTVHNPSLLAARLQDEVEGARSGLW